MVQPEDFWCRSSCVTKTTLCVYSHTMAEPEKPPWARIAKWLGTTVSGLGGAWLVTYGAIVATAPHGKHAVSQPFWIWPTVLAVAALFTGILLVMLGEIGPRRSKDDPDLSQTKGPRAAIRNRKGAVARTRRGHFGPGAAVDNEGDYTSEDDTFE